MTAPICPDVGKRFEPMRYAMIDLLLVPFLDGNKDEKQLDEILLFG